MYERLDITLTASETSLSKIPVSTHVRFYESSFPGVTSIVLYGENGMDAGTRISRDDTIRLYHALGSYLAATEPIHHTPVNREENTTP